MIIRIACGDPAFWTACQNRSEQSAIVSGIVCRGLRFVPFFDLCSQPPIRSAIAAWISPEEACSLHLTANSTLKHALQHRNVLEMNISATINQSMRGFFFFGCQRVLCAGAIQDFSGCGTDSSRHFLAILALAACIVCPDALSKAVQSFP
jgi:hypothetical protein